MMNTDTGFSTSEINAHADATSWARLLPRMLAGATLSRPSTKLRTYYVDGSGGFQPSFVKRLERDGVIRRVGVETYQLVKFLDCNNDAAKANAADQEETP